MTREGATREGATREGRNGEVQLYRGGDRLGYMMWKGKGGQFIERRKNEESDGEEEWGAGGRRGRKGKKNEGSREGEM